jgi:hypothetical protein
LVVGIHVSTIFYVDTMLLDWRRHCQMGWPDAYTPPRSTTPTSCEKAARGIAANSFHYSNLSSLNSRVC